MPDGSFSENPVPKQETLRKLPKATTEPLRLRAQDLTGNEINSRFKTPGGLVEVDTLQVVALKDGYRHPGDILPKTDDTIITIKNPHGRPHPDFSDVMLYHYETIHVRGGKTTATVDITKGERDEDWKFSTMKPSTENPEKRIQELTALLSTIEQTDRVDRFGRTVTERAEDRRQAEAIRRKIDDLLDLARAENALIEDNPKVRRTQFREDHEQLPNIAVIREKGEYDTIIINETQSTRTLDNGIQEVPVSNYDIPHIDHPSQRITTYTTFQHEHPEGGISLPVQQLVKTFVDSEGTAHLLKRLDKLDASNFHRPHS